MVGSSAVLQQSAEYTGWLAGVVLDVEHLTVDHPAVDNLVVGVVVADVDLIVEHLADCVPQTGKELSALLVVKVEEYSQYVAELTVLQKLMEYLV